MAHASTKLAIYAALGANFLIAVTKFGAAWFTDSSAMLSEGVHSLVDTGNQLLLLYGMWRAARPASDEFPFGHGKEIYFWSFVVAILIFALGAGISIYEGILHLADPQPMRSVLTNDLVLGSAIVFEAVSWWISAREFNKQRGDLGYLGAIHQGKDPALFLVLLEDSAALVGLVVALAGVTLAHLTGVPLYDGGASVLIGLLLGGIAVLLARETKGLLIGESAVPETGRAIREILAREPDIVGVHEVLTLQMGPHFVLATVTADFADHVPAGAVEATVARLRAEIRGRLPDVQRVFIEPRAGDDPRPA
jgi:cation diffusion facilitator family transporter